MKKLILINLLCFSFLLWKGAGDEVIAQDQHLNDSLHTVLKSLKSDLDRINVLNSISAELFLKHDIKSAMQYANEALLIAKDKGSITGIATALTNIGKSNSEQHNYVDALKQLNTAANLFKKINDKSNLAECYYSLGSVYYFLDNNPKALENLFASLKLFQESSNLPKIGKVFTLIGLTYQYQAWYSNDSNYYSTSLINLNNALQIFEKLNDKDQKARCYNFIALVYLMKGEDDNAMKDVSIALKLLNGSKERESIARSFNTIGTINERKGLAFIKENKLSDAVQKFSVAKHYFLAAYNIIMNESQNKNFLSEILVNLGSINFDMQSYTESQFYLDNALELSKKFGFKDIVRDSYSLYEKLDSTQGNYRNAFIHYKLYTIYKDSLSNEENTKKMVQIKLQYETEKKEKQIALLTKESQLQQTNLQKQASTRNVFIVAFALIALLAGIIYNRYRIKVKANAKIEKTLHHLKTTQAQLVEHEKLATLGRFTAEVAREMELPVKEIKQLSKLNKRFILNIKSNNSINDTEVLKNNLKHIFNYGKEADEVVKRVLTETRRIQS